MVKCILDGDGSINSIGRRMPRRQLHQRLSEQEEYSNTEGEFVFNHSRRTLAFSGRFVRDLSDLLEEGNKSLRLNLRYEISLQQHLFDAGKGPCGKRTLLK